MFKFLTIKNHRSHVLSKFRFSPGVNVFIGISQSGKTAIIRALLWLFNNQPSGGNFFYNRGKKGDSVKVELGLDEGPIISLEKWINRNKKNEKKVISSEYKLDDNSYSGIKKGVVPDLIKNVLNISNLNIQEQLDPFFLICSTSGEIIKTINRIIHAEKIDGWILELTKRINKINNKVSILDDDIKKIKEDLIFYERLDEVGQLISKLDVIEEKIDEKIYYTEKLKEICFLVKKCKNNIKKIKEIFIPATNFLNKAIDYENKIKDKEKEYLLVCKVLDFHFNVLKLKKIKVNDLIDEVENIHRTFLNLDREKLLITGSLNLSMKEKELGKKYSKIKNKYIELLVRINKCPYCFSFISKSTLENIIKEMGK